MARTTPPQPSSRTLTRPRLLAALDEASHWPVTLVTGGPGSGKTQLLIDWVRTQPLSQPIAWVALGEDCNDPHRLWSLVLTAFQRVEGAPDELAAMRPPKDVDQVFLEQVVWALGTLETRVTLVLEDVHEVRSRAALEGLEQLIRSVPDNLHVVMVARSDPPLSVHRLRIAGELGEVRQAALAFTREEAARLFAQHDLELTDLEMDQVLARTEGWAAGLRLAALSLEGHDAPDERARAVAAFAGDTRAVADYLMTEVLEQQSEHLREFMLLTSVVERIDASLADALVGGGRGAEALDSLERSGALLVALDGQRGWYRYHRLFLEMCRHRLAVERAEAVPGLHARAARWFSEHDEPLEALGHALQSDDRELFAWIAVSQAGALVFGHEGRAARALLRQAPDDSGRSSPWFACARALGYFDEGDQLELERRLVAAESLLTDLDPRAQRAPALVLSLIRSAAARGGGDVDAAARHSAQALLLARGLSATEVPALPRYLALAHVLHGKSLIWSGQLAEAEKHLRAGRDLVPPGPGVHLVDESAVLAGAYVSLVLAMKGDLEAARLEAIASLATAADAGWADDVQSTSAHLSLAIVYLQRSELAACELALDQAAAVLDRKPDVLLEISHTLAGVRLLALSDQEAAAREALAAARELVAGLPRVDFLSGWLTLVEAETALAAGHYEQVLALIDDRDGLVQVRGQARVLSGRALLALGRTREALDVVAPVSRADEPPLVSVGAWLVTAVGELELRRDAAAMASLDQALDRAAPEQLLRPFRESRTALRPLLERYLAGFGSHSALVESILGLEDPGFAVPVESLTDRELAVLQLLPTMMSNSEIADELFVSVNTVKAHLKSLYRKLGVTSRRDAVIQGRRLAPPPQPAVTEPLGSR